MTGISPTRYRILGQVGQGQFGQVLCAIDRQTGLLVALKVLPKRDLSTRFFLRELRLLASLQHANIVSVQTIAYTAKERYLVMDYCEGGTLRDLIMQRIHLSLGQRLQIIMDVLNGLDYAHQHQIVHCDLKPENILLTHTPKSGLARITDFGIARLVEESGYGVIGQGDTGSPAYMAPERYYSEYSYSSDIYAIGVILFELLVGKRPFMGLPGELMTAHLNQMVQVPNQVPFLLRSVLRTALQKLPQKRFQNAGEMLKAVKLAANVLATEESATYHLAPSQSLPQGAISPEIQQEECSHPIQCILVADNQVYLSRRNTVICRTYTSIFPEQSPIAEIQWQLPQEVITLFWMGQQCWARTIQDCNGNPCFHPLTLDKDAIAVGETCPQDIDQSTVASPNSVFSDPILPSSPSLIGWLPTQNWVVLTSHQSVEPLRMPAVTDDKTVLQMLRLPQEQPIHQAEIIDQPDWLFLLDPRYGVAITAEQFQPSQLRLFTRRGTYSQRFPIPMALEHIIQSDANPYHFLATATDSPRVGFLINLKPWRLRRIALAIKPERLLAMPWGYVLIEAGQVLILGLDGQPLGQFMLSFLSTETITAMTAIADQGFMIATESETSAMLYTIDVRALLTRFNSEAVTTDGLETTLN